MKRPFRINSRARRRRLLKGPTGWKQLATFVAGCSFLLPAGQAAETGGTTAASTTSPDKPKAIMDMDLTELTQIQVTSVSKRPEKLSDAAAAIYVITNEDIRRSGAT